MISSRSNFVYRAYSYLRSKFPAIPYRRLDLSSFPRSSSLGFKIKGKTAYIIVHHGEPIHPSEDLLHIPPGQTIWGTRPLSPLTGNKILGDDACCMTSEDVAVAHAISLFYEEQREGGYVEREIAALKAEDTWSRDGRPPDSRSLKSERSGTQASEKRSLHSIFKPKLRRAELNEKGEVENDKQERSVVCPWEVL